MIHKVEQINHRLFWILYFQYEKQKLQNVADERWTDFDICDQFH